MQPVPQPLEELKVRAIAQRSTRGVRPNGNLKADCGKELGCLDDREVGRQPAGHSADLRTRQPDVHAHVDVREAMALDRVAELMSHRPDRGATAQLARDDGPASSNHGQIFCVTTYLAIIAVGQPWRRNAEPAAGRALA